MTDTLLRQWAMLRHIPRHPRKVDTVTLQNILAKQGHDITLRTIQRDLNKLSLALPLISDEAKPQGWSWEANAEVLDLPALDPQTALTFKLVESHMGQLLPASTLDYLQPWFRTAKGVLDQHGNGLAHWPDKIRVLPRGMMRKVPDIKPEVAEALYQAILTHWEAPGSLVIGASEPPTPLTDRTRWCRVPFRLASPRAGSKSRSATTCCRVFPPTS